MIKVIHICSDTNIGGAGRYLLNLWQSSDKKQFKTLFILPKNSQLTTMLQQHGAKVLELNISADKSFDGNDIAKLYRVIKKLHPDIVHTHGSFSGRIATKLTRQSKIIYTRHYVDDANKADTINFKDKLKGVLNNLSCDGVIGVATQCEPIISKMGIPKSKIAIIPNGVVRQICYTDNEIALLKQKYNIPQNNPTITILARLSQEKGHNVFIETVEELNKIYPDFTAIIAGVGEEEENIKRAIKARNLEDKICMVGFLDNVSDILNITTVQLNTSYTEAQSLSLSEGMSIGIPAVVSDVGGNPSMIREGKNGFVVPVGDAKSFAKQTVEIFENDALYKKLSDNAKEIYQQHYTADKMTHQTENFYKAIISR